MAAAAAGLSALIAASATAFTILKYVGGALRQGILTEALNPKTALFFLTFLPQFCQPENGPLGLQMLVLGTISVVMNTLADVVVAHGAGHVSEWLRTRPKVWRRQQLATGGILVGLGVYTAAAGHRAK